MTCSPPPRRIVIKRHLAEIEMHGPVLRIEAMIDIGSGAKRVRARAREIVRDGRVEPATIESVRIRISDAPLDRVHARGQLAPPRDTERNELLFTAGTRFRELWTSAGLHGLRAQDPGRLPASRTGLARV